MLQLGWFLPDNGMRSLRSSQNAKPILASDTALQIQCTLTLLSTAHVTDVH